MRNAYPLFSHIQQQRLTTCARLASSALREIASGALQQAPLTLSLPTRTWLQKITWLAQQKSANLPKRYHKLELYVVELQKMHQGKSGEIKKLIKDMYQVLTT